ncbi:nucleotidyltransferase, partial [Anaerostipes caccae]|uniref:NTP transferase domain-containing protein n=1 Tax=Anaerostipes caccae TaxID=105841 RepID=UPI002ED376C1|nr:nucleotidyltransferase [Anaerostipes caccae]
MKKPALVILAAGMGSRYGGLKQMDPMDDQGHAIIDYSIYDAKRAGFGKVVFVIKKGIEKDFKETVGSRIPDGMGVCYAFQEGCPLPE